ncbi:MAG: hypothetical protein DWQ36_20560 [Acidobacteria bacterium]|nr:MAG: hypothetical protein DWQ30_20985 [Acidobacteriota bacterium]REK03263.1 MAG: hypothetical protein DWQ36_20560 [Acidobacteriota bacterium]
MPLGPSRRQRQAGTLPIQRLNRCLLINAEDGDILREAGLQDEALAEYRAALERSPNRFNSLFGAGQAAEGSGDVEAARGFYTTLLEIYPDPTEEHPELEHARAFVEGSAASG